VNFEFWQTTLEKVYTQWLDILILPKSLLVKIFMIGDCSPKSLMYALDKLIRAGNYIEISFHEEEQTAYNFSFTKSKLSFLVKLNTIPSKNF